MTQLYCNALYFWLSIHLQSIATLFSLVVRWQTGFSTTWWCGLKPKPGGKSRIFVPFPLCHTINPSLTYSYSDCGPVIEYNLAVGIVVHYKRGLDYLTTLLSCVYSESSTFYIFMLYILIHTVLAVEFVVVLWSRVYHLCTVKPLNTEPFRTEQKVRYSEVFGFQRLMSWVLFFIFF